uniref:Eukaryotic translation initiation factor 3 30 kDa subunit n=1 Tax=Parascaris univalens TaxID=6257 RepID=A0A915BQ48_PARUN
MGDWDDDDFEPDVKQLDEKKGSIIEEVEEAAPEEHIVPKPQPSKPKPKSKAKSPLGSFAADLGRELTAKEREEIQMKSDLGFAKDLFGTNGDGPTSYSEITTIEEFRMFGEEVGQMLATRANATHYVEMVTVLLKVALEKLDANKTRHLSAVVKSIADEKSNAEKVEKKTKGKGGAAKPTVKVTQKSNVNKDIYDDYAGLEDPYDDYEDDFM